jgi:hypothetical protein
VAGIRSFGQCNRDCVPVQLMNRRPGARIFLSAPKLDILHIDSWCSPGGRNENSPAVHCRERIGVDRVPKGRLNAPFWVGFQPSHRDSIRFQHPPNVETLGYCRMSLRDRSHCHAEKISKLQRGHSCPPRYRNAPGKADRNVRAPPSPGPRPVPRSQQPDNRRNAGTEHSASLSLSTRCAPGTARGPFVVAP